MNPARSPSDNRLGILYMVAAVTGFIVNDTCVKLASEDIPIGQIILLRSAMAVPIVLVAGWRQGAFRGLSQLGDRFLWLRTLGEVGATALYLAALAHMDIANATAIIQLTPLAITAAAAIFLGERVGVRRWTAITIGFLAVLVIIRPGMQGFSGWSLFAFFSVGFIALRDLASRLMPAAMHPLAVSIVSLAAVVALGGILSAFETWGPVTPKILLYCLGSAVSLSVSFVLIILAMRHGEIALVAPFRYTILLWAIIVQIVVFSVWPDALTLLGGAVLVATGLYTLYRERQLRRGAAPLLRPLPAAPSR
jgi:drug/metabolite transporter (DMT)-like permease